jgi:hypothetical protein
MKIIGISLSIFMGTMSLLTHITEFLTSVFSFCSLLIFKIFSFCHHISCLEEFMCGMDYAHFYLYRPPIVLLNLDNQYMSVMYHKMSQGIHLVFLNHASGKRFVLCFNICGVMM